MFTRMILVICVLISTASLAEAKKKQPLAKLSVLDVHSKLSQSEVIRAIIIREEIYFSLVMELIKRGETEGDPDRLVKQRRVRFLPKASAVVDRAKPISWKGRTLRLSVISQERKPKLYQCEVSTAGKSFGRAKCRLSKTDL
ncbi:MAG: hypothetical protein JRH20_05455 [Deltaproteobacteria bacterium]|nr:hypothetical protein [Deltaproteobacteria bacterium]